MSCGICCDLLLRANVVVFASSNAHKLKLLLHDIVVSFLFLQKWTGTMVHACAKVCKWWEFGTCQTSDCSSFHCQFPLPSNKKLKGAACRGKWLTYYLLRCNIGQIYRPGSGTKGINTPFYVRTQVLKNCHAPFRAHSVTIVDCPRLQCWDEFAKLPYPDDISTNAEYFKDYKLF